MEHDLRVFDAAGQQGYRNAKGEVVVKPRFYMAYQYRGESIESR